MAKQIHIHIHRHPTGDSGNFDESKHKRDESGKFSSGGGGGGKPESKAPGASKGGQQEKQKPGLEIFQSPKLLKELREAESGRTGKASAKKSTQPQAPNLSGPRSQAAIKAIQEAAARGDWRAVNNVNVLGTHPQVAHYRMAMSEWLDAGGRAFAEATSPPTPKETGTERPYLGKGNHKPGWMLKADPKLALALKEAESRRAERKRTK